MEITLWFYLSFMDNQFIISNSFWDYAIFYQTVDRNECTYFVKIEFCFLLFPKDHDTMQGKHNQKEAGLRHCKVSDADLVLNIYFSDVKTFILH